MLNSSFQVTIRLGLDDKHLYEHWATRLDDIDSGCQVCMNDGSSRNMANLMITLKHLFCFRYSQHLARGKFMSVPSARARVWTPSSASSMLTWARAGGAVWDKKSHLRLRLGGLIYGQSLLWTEPSATSE